MERISSIVVIREVNNSEGEKPRFSNDDARKLTLVKAADDAEFETFALAKGNGTLLVKVTNEKPIRKLIDYRWITW